MRLRFPVGNVRTSTLVLAAFFLVAAVTYLMAPIPESVLRERPAGTPVQTEQSQDDATPTETGSSPTESAEPTPDPAQELPTDSDTPTPDPDVTSPDETASATSTAPSGTSAPDGDPSQSP